MTENFCKGGTSELQIWPAVEDTELELIGSVQRCVFVLANDSCISCIIEEELTRERGRGNR